MWNQYFAKLERLAAERPVYLAFMVFLAATLIVVPASLPFYLLDPWGFLENILSEAHGMLFDLLVIGCFGYWLTHRAERRQKNNRYQEEVEDFLGWRSPEATHRIAGNIRRLNRGGVTDNLRLTEAFLRGANLAGAKLAESDLWGADLEGAMLRDACLDRANLAGANLQRANLERAHLLAADLRGAHLEEADLERAVLDQADLRGATLTNADLQYASMQGTNLERTSLAGANLRGATLEAANLGSIDLTEANLRRAVFGNANLTDACLTHADLVGADFLDLHQPDGEALVALFADVKTLFGAKFAPEIKEKLEAAHPSLFQIAHNRSTKEAVVEE
ncbi:MAG TPA: pentapeptide repeat-containing protein [Rhodothermales bacterium]|nr:pentapeptide repeat-containing protein [Rhodothermales bacterium]